MAELNNTENKLGLLNIIVIILSIYVLGALMEISSRLTTLFLLSVTTIFRDPKQLIPQ